MCEKEIDFSRDNPQGSLFPDFFEERLHTAFQHESGKIGKLTLNFSAIQYIDVVTLLNIISFSQSFLTNENKPDLKIIFPKSSSVLAFLKYWNFDGGFQDATGRNFLDLIDGENKHTVRRYFTSAFIDNLKDLGEREYNYFTYPTLNLTLSELISHGDKKRNFFGITNFFLNPGKTESESYEKNKQIEKDEVNRWKQKDVNNIIYNVIEKRTNGEFSGYMSAKVIMESVSNALMHPNGSTFQIASRFTKLPGSDKKIFTIALWDNGESMIDTLKSAYENHHNIKAELPQNIEYPKFEFKFPVDGRNHDVLIKPEDPLKSPDFESYFEVHKAVYKDPFIFLATFFPGVTSKPHRDEVNKGMGLYYLYKAITESFEGKLIVRSGKYRMRIKTKEKASNLFVVNIKEVPSYRESFNGNLLEFHIPVVE